MSDDQTATTRRPSRRLWTVLGGGAVAVIVAAFVIWPGVPDTVGVRNGSLAPCPGTPNCVHTGLRHPDGTRGIFLQGRLVRSEIIPSLVEVVESMPRTTIIEQSEQYIHAEVRSRFFRFIDDLELYVSPDRELIVRSASRVGRGDAGVNAARVAELRERLTEAGLIR